MIFSIIGAVLVVILLWAALSYNSLIRLRNRTKEAWADIDVQLKRRYDLIPNLVSTVQGYATHEKSTLDAVVTARTAAMGATSVHDKETTEATLSGALKSVFALAEAYPDLKANQGFLSLQTELANTEDIIQMSRRFYNGNVRDFNTSIQVFPNNLLANAFHFTQMEFFQLDAADGVARQPVQVKF